jgi:hypothetical protein
VFDGSLEELPGCNCMCKRAIRTIFAEYMGFFRSTFFTNVTQAELLTDWSSMCQLGNKTVVESRARLKGLQDVL